MVWASHCTQILLIGSVDDPTADIHSCKYLKSGISTKAISSFVAMFISDCLGVQMDFDSCVLVRKDW